MPPRLLRSCLSLNLQSVRREIPRPHRWWKESFNRSYSPPRQLDPGAFKLLNHIERVEEENWAWYSEDAYYPVKIGETFHSRYQILGKLGYGAHSTVWLGRDLHAHEYVTVKVCERDSRPAEREVAVYEHLNSLTFAHKGAQLLRRCFDHFTIKVPGGQHLCLVLEPLGMSVKDFGYLMPEELLSEDVLRSVLSYLLLTLDCLHTECKTIHADLQANNILFRVEDSTIFEDYEQRELEDPRPRKVDGPRIIYESRGLRWTNKIGPSMLCDFGEARFGQSSYEGIIQPFVYRAPEVVLDMRWSYEVDIWNVGVMIWDLFEGRHLFDARSPTREPSSLYHLAEMYAILGPPPLEYLQRTKTASEYFNADVTRLSGDNKARFLSFVRKMLQWEPEKRHTAKQLLEDPWLNE